jgi:ribonuclease BN (tRNA processing enzyme)
MIEAMTNGGFDKKGIIYLPKDAFEIDNVVMNHFRNHVREIKFLEEKKQHKIGNICFRTPKKNIHGVESYGIKFFSKNLTISMTSDTKFYEGIIKHYDGDILILNVVLLNSVDKIAHLSIEDAENIIKKLKPKLTILTHFGMKVIKARPWEIAEDMSKKLGCKIIAARDGMKIDLSKYKN